jgi:hypothetical protein
MSNINLIGGITNSSTLYYNILIKNNNTGFDEQGNPITINNSVPLIFDETRSNPYIVNPYKYYMSVINFQVDSQSLPILIAEPIVGSNNIYDTIYWITITDNDNAELAHVNIQWIPDDLSVPEPIPPVQSNYTSNPYYYCYSYGYFLGLINKTISNAMADNSIAGNPPFLTLNNGIFSITADEATWSTDISGNTSSYKLFFNTELYYLFSSLTALKNKEPLNNVAETKNANYQLLFNKNPSGSNYVPVYTDLTTVPLVSDYNGIVSTCEYSPVPYWNPVDSIVFKVSNLYITPELISANTAYGTADGKPPTNADQYYILADYAASFIGDDTYQPNIMYEPIAEYILSDLTGRGEIRQLQITTSWKDKNGVLHVMNLESGGTASIKIMFRRKDFN